MDCTHQCVTGQQEAQHAFEPSKVVREGFLEEMTPALRAQDA